MSDIESEEYEIMDFPEISAEEDIVEIEQEEEQLEEQEVETENFTEKVSPVLPHSVMCEYKIRDIIETPNTSYIFSTSEYCDNIKELTGEVDGVECPGVTTFKLCNKNWLSSAKMELTLTLNRDKILNNKNVTDASVLTFNSGHSNSVSVETDDVDEENKDFRVLTFSYSKNEFFSIETDLAYKWTLRTLNGSEFNVTLSYEPNFFKIVQNLKNNELKSASKRRFNSALQKIYVEQLKKDGNYYCQELKTAKDRIHNLDIDLKEAKGLIEHLQEECESVYSRKEAALIKQRSTLQEIKELKCEFNRMKFLKDFYISETKIAKDKRMFAEKNLKETTKERDELKEECDKLNKELNGSRIKYDKIKKRYNELEDECDGLDAELEEVRRINDELRAWESEDEEFEELKRRNDELEEKLELMEDQQVDYNEEIDELKYKNKELKEKLDLLEEQQAEYEETINIQSSTIKSMDTISKDVDIYKDLAKKYKANLELKDRDIENLEDIITEYKNELNKPIKYREEVKSLKADNAYLKTDLVRLKQEYAKLNNKSNHSKWANETIVKNLQKEIAYLKGKRINKKKIETDISDFHKRGYDMLDWYKHCSGNYTNEFIQFQKETEFLFNDVLNYFKTTLLNKNKDKQA